MDQPGRAQPKEEATQVERHKADLWTVSHAVEGQESQKIEIREAISEVTELLGQWGIWAMDRGGDRRHLFNYHVLRTSKRLFGILDFRLYALADGGRLFLCSQR